MEHAKEMLEGVPKELVKSVSFIAQCAHTRLEPIRKAPSLNPTDIWTALEYIEEIQLKLRLLTNAIDISDAETARLGALLADVFTDSGFRCLDETLQERIAQ